MGTHAVSSPSVLVVVAWVLVYPPAGARRAAVLGEGGTRCRVLLCERVGAGCSGVHTHTLILNRLHSTSTISLCLCCLQPVKEQ